MTMTDRKPNPADATEAITLRPIGFVESDYREPTDVRHTRRGWTAEGSRIRLLDRWAGGLGGLEGYSHVLVLFWIHRAKDWRMPTYHRKPPHVKVFATRMPVRPNPIGVSVVEVVDVSPATGEVTVKGLDALDGTPILDLKPYIPDFDSLPDARIPDWVERHLRGPMHSHGHGDHDHGHDGDNTDSAPLAPGA